MKKFHSFVLFLFYSAITFSNNPEIIVEHRMNGVTLFLNSAEISRIASVNIPAGKTDLIFKGISKRVLEEGTKLFISENVRVIKLSIEENRTVLEEDEKYLLLESRNDSISLEISKILMRESILESELLYYESNMKVNQNNSSSFEEIEKGADFFRKKISEIEEKMFIAERELKKMKNLQSKIYNTYVLGKGKADLTGSTFRITVESEVPVNAQVDLKYLVSNALWKPYYSVRANDNSSKVEIEYQAQLYNNTGNDWSGQAISLAILNSSDDVTKPELEIWNIEEGRRKFNKNATKSKNPISKYEKNSLRDIDGDGKSQKYDYVVIDDLSTRFEISEPHDIPSDARPHVIDVLTFIKDVEFYNLSIPKVKNGAFLIARIKDWESLGLIDGDINLYYNDTYQGLSKLRTNEINDTLDLSLGKENNFIVSRKKVSSSSKKRLIGFNITEVFTYEVLVKNNNSESASIEVRDQIPISNSKDVEIRPLNLSSGKLDRLTGEVIWNLNVKAGETKKLLLKFSVKYPKSKKGGIEYKTTIVSSPRYF